MHQALDTLLDKSHAISHAPLLQVWVQLFLSACRVAVVLLMVGTTLSAYHSDTPVFGSQGGTCPSTPRITQEGSILDTR